MRGTVSRSSHNRHFLSFTVRLALSRCRGKAGHSVNDVSVLMELICKRRKADHELAHGSRKGSFQMVVSYVKNENGML